MNNPYDGAMSSEGMDSDKSEEHEVRMLQRSMSSPILFAVVLGVVTELAREGVFIETLMILR